MSWQDKTITLGELSRLLREERMLSSSVGYPGDFNNGLDCIAGTVASVVLKDADEALGFIEDARGFQ